jgi:hypothetical protein
MYNPTTATRPEQNRMNADLREYDDFTKNFVRDVKRVTIVEFNNLLGAGPINLMSMGNGNPTLDDINTSDIGALDFDATGEIYGFSVILPEDMDPTQEVGFRVKWLKVQAAAAGTGGATWALTYNAALTGVTALAIGATVLTVPIPASVDAAQYVTKWTEEGTIAAGSLSALTPGDDALDCSVAVTLDTITDAQLMAVQMIYRTRLL